MPVQVLVVVTTHNSIISTARSWRPWRKKTFPRFFLLRNNFFLPWLIYLRLSHPTDPPRDALQYPPRGGGPASLRCNALLGGGLRPLRCCVGPTSFRTCSGAVHDERAGCTCSWHGLCSKTWNSPRMEVETLWVSTWKKHNRVFRNKFDCVDRVIDCNVKVSNKLLHCFFMSNNYSNMIFIPWIIRAQTVGVIATLKLPLNWPSKRGLDVGT